MALKILATADLHIGMKFSGYPEVQAKLTGARVRTLSRLIDKANLEECGLFLIAGDLFERVTIPKNTVLEVAALLDEFQGACLAVLPGNHDYYSSGSSSLWKLFNEKKGDRVLLLDRQEPCGLGHYGLNVVLYPGPCTAKHAQENAISWIHEPRGNAEAGTETKPETLHIGLAHGSIAGMSLDAQGNYFPMTVEALERAGLDFWVVGHTHLRYPDKDSSGTTLFVPGTPEPDGFDCGHGGTAWIIEASNPKLLNKKPLDTGEYRFHRRELSLDNDSDLSNIFNRYRSPDFKKTLIKLELKGTLAAEKLRSLREIIRDLEDSLFWSRIDDGQVAEQITPERVEAEFTEGSFPYLLLKELIDAEDREALQAAYALIQEVRS